MKFYGHCSKCGEAYAIEVEPLLGPAMDPVYVMVLCRDHTPMNEVSLRSEDRMNDGERREWQRRVDAKRTIRA